MDQYEYIRTASRVYGKGIRQIQRETGHSRVTIRKVLEQEHSDYKKRGHQPCPILGVYHQSIESWLKADQEVPKKQRHTARRIYTRLVEEEGFQGSEVNVRRHVRLAKARLGLQAPGTFLILEPDCGREAEADWVCNSLATSRVVVIVLRNCLSSVQSFEYVCSQCLDA